MPGPCHRSCCRWLLGLLLAVSSQARSSAADDWSTDQWIGLDAAPPVTIGATLSGDQLDNRSFSAYLLAPLTERLLLDLSWSQTQLQGSDNDFDSQDIGGQLSWSIDDSIELLGGYRYQGQPDELEIDYITLGMRYNRPGYAVELSRQQGSATLHARDNLPAGWPYPRQISSDLQAWYLRLDWFADRWGLYLSSRSFDYERDLTALGSNQLLQLVAAPGALEQGGLLIEEQLRLGLHHHGPALGINLEWARSSSAIDSLSSDSLQLDFSYLMNTRGPGDSETRLLFGIGHVFDAASPWSLVAGLEWTGG